MIRLEKKQLISLLTFVNNYLCGIYTNHKPHIMKKLILSIAVLSTMAVVACKQGAEKKEDAAAEDTKMEVEVKEVMQDTTMQDSMEMKMEKSDSTMTADMKAAKKIKEEASH